VARLGAGRSDSAGSRGRLFVAVLVACLRGNGCQRELSSIAFGWTGGVNEGRVVSSRFVARLQ
jgi:hypothetical protein